MRCKKHLQISLLSCHCKQEMHLLRWLHSKIQHVQKTFPVIFTGLVFFFFPCHSCPKCCFYKQFCKSFMSSSVSPLLPWCVRAEASLLAGFPALGYSSSCCLQLLRDFWSLTDWIWFLSTSWVRMGNVLTAQLPHVALNREQWALNSSWLIAVGLHCWGFFIFRWRDAL